MARRTWTDNSIAALKPRAGRYAEPDSKLSGHYVRVTPNGAKSFVAVSRDPRGNRSMGSRAVGSNPTLSARTPYFSIS